MEAPGEKLHRRLLEMVVAMMIGMGVFGLALTVMEPPGYANLLVQYDQMGVLFVERLHE